LNLSAAGHAENAATLGDIGDYAAENALPLDFLRNCWLVVDIGDCGPAFTLRAYKLNWLSPLRSASCG
jgi:hypothetical protein